MQRKLFIAGKDLRTQAYFGWQDKNTALLGIRMGYKDAADKLVDKALEEGELDNIRVLDTYIFPICFLYRHSIEASLKGIYLRYCGNLLKGNHDLVTLWDNLYKEVILTFDDSDFIEEVKKYKENFIKYSLDDINFNELRNMFVEFNRFNDNKADVFRYLLDKDGELYFTDSKYIDYPNLKENMRYIYDVLDYIFFITDEYLSS